MKACLEAANAAEIEREKVEEERPVSLGGQRDQFAFGLGIGFVVDPLQIRGFSAQARTVIDDLAIDLPRGVIDERHSLNRLSMSSSVISANGESKRLARFPRSASDFFRSCSNVFSSSCDAFFTRSRTSPSDERSSKITTRMTRCATSEIWMLSRSPS